MNANQYTNMCWLDCLNDFKVFFVNFYLCILYNLTAVERVSEGGNNSQRQGRTNDLLIKYTFSVLNNDIYLMSRNQALLPLKNKIADPVK